MKNNLFSLKMNPTLQALYLDELNQTGMEVDDTNTVIIIQNRCIPVLSQEKSNGVR